MPTLPLVYPARAAPAPVPHRRLVTPAPAAEPRRRAAPPPTAPPSPPGKLALRWAKRAPLCPPCPHDLFRGGARGACVRAYTHGGQPVAVAVVLDLPRKWVGTDPRGAALLAGPARGPAVAVVVLAASEAVALAPAVPLGTVLLVASGRGLAALLARFPGAGRGAA